MKPKGMLALVLHAHLPYVRHPEYEKSIEEHWLFEAITETYIPLLAMFHRLDRDGVPCRITMSLTPTLGSLLQDEFLMDRYTDYLKRMVILTEKELERTRWQPEIYPLAQMYYGIYTKTLDIFSNHYQRDLVTAFRTFQEKGLVEIIASAATHGFLPLMDHPQAVNGQIGVGVDWYRSSFRRDPIGLWLPECGYAPGIEKALRDHDICYVITDTHGVLHSTPKPRYAIYAPVLSSNGIAFFGRDGESSKQVWSATEGYPGDYDYRDFYRDIGYDCDYEYVKNFLPGHDRGHTGVKYHRITGETMDKAIYCPENAREKAASHAGNFMFNREKQIEHVATHMDREPMIVAPYDAELFGHWWFEGPQWLEFLIRKIAFDQDTIKLATPGEYLERYPRNQVVQPSMSTWGNNGYNEVWLDDCNDWVYRHLSLIATEMVNLANIETDDPLIARGLNQALREVLLAQSSDWAFIMKAGTMVSYAEYRTKIHVHRFWRLHEQIMQGQMDSRMLAEFEAENSIFPALDYRIYRVNRMTAGSKAQIS